MTDNITHLCLASNNCRAKVTLNTKHGKTQSPAGTQQPNTLCNKCFHHTQQSIEALPADYARLAAAIGDIDHHDTGEKVRGTNALPMPFNGQRDALMRAIVEYLRIATRRITGNDHTDKTGYTAVNTCAALTAAQLDKLLETKPIPEEVWTAGDRRELVTKTGADIALKLADLHTQATNELEGHKASGRVQLGYGCDSCGEPNLYREGDNVKCPNRACRKDWTDPAYATFNAALAEQTRRDEMEKELAKTTTQRDQARAERDQAHWLAAEAQHRIARVQEIKDRLEALADDPATATVYSAAVAELLTLALGPTCPGN